MMRHCKFGQHDAHVDDFAPSMSRCRACDAEYSRLRRSRARPAAEVAFVPAIDGFMRANAALGGNANAPALVGVVCG